MKTKTPKARVMWAKINRSRLPKTGVIVAGSYRGGVWTMSSPSVKGFPYWSDGDRTHYFRLPVPPALTAAGIPCAKPTKQRRAGK